jgi:hypothetical protein
MEILRVAKSQPGVILQTLSAILAVQIFPNR